MAKDNETTGDLRKAATITDAEIAQAADAYLADPSATAVTFASGHRLDIADAIAAHAPSKAALAEPGASPAFRRTMVLTAILLARPVAG